MAVDVQSDVPQYKQTRSDIWPTQYEVGSLVDRLLTQGFKEGLEIAFQTNMLIGKIHTLQELLEEPVTPHDELWGMNNEELTVRADDLLQRWYDSPAGRRISGSID